MEVPVIGQAMAHGPLVREEVWAGLVYPGEVWVIRQWEPAVAAPLPRGCCFRVVFSLSPLGDDLPAPIPPGVAVCSASRPLEPTIRRLQRQVRAVREARARYLADFPPSAREAEAKEGVLHTSMLQEAATVYREGKVWPASLTLSEVFTSPDPEGWVQKITLALFQRWGTPLWDGSLWPRPLRPSDAPLLWDALLSPWPTAAALEVLETFGPGLGLQRGTPPQGDGLGPLLEEASSKNLPLAALLARWEQDRGVPWWLGWLWVGAFIAFGRPLQGIRLLKSCPVALLQNRQVQVGRLTPALLTEVQWDNGLVDTLGPVEPLGSPPVEELVVHVSPLLTAQGISTQRMPVSEMGRVLEDALRALKARLLRLRSGLEDARAVWEPEPRQREALVLLERVAEAGAAGVYALLQEEGVGPGRLDGALQTLKRCEAALAALQEARQGKAFLEQASIPPQYAEASLERQILLAQLSDLAEFAVSPERWPAVREAFQRFQARYRSLYRVHHRDMRQRVQEAGERLRLLTPALEVLEALNSLTELGAPQEPRLREERDVLLQRLQPCPLTEEQVPVESLPYCWLCRLALGEQPPLEEAQRLALRLQNALLERCQRLSASAIEQALATPGKDVVERLVQVVQLADLSPLVRVFSPQVLELLRQVVRSARG